MLNMDIANFGYILVILLITLSFATIRYRRNLGRAFRQAGTWLLIFVGFVAIGSSWQDIRQTSMFKTTTSENDKAIVVFKEADGHLYLNLEVNNKMIKFLVDTGATDIVLTRKDAARIGLDANNLKYWGYAKTANGVVGLASVRLDTVSIAGITDKNVKASVNEGLMDTSLLGMSYLNKFKTIEIKRNRMILMR